MLYQRTSAALGFARMADGPAESYQVYVQGVCFAFWEQLSHDLMCLVGGCVCRDEVESLGDPEDVGVYGKNILPAGEA